MKNDASPFFVTPAALMFWGWQTRLWPLALTLSVLAVSHFIFTVRWDFSSKDYSRISDLCGLFFFGCISYLYLSVGTIYVIFKLIQWLPIISSPLLIAQHYSISGKIDLRAISFFFRNSELTKARDLNRYQINMDYPYALLCIISAGFGNQRGLAFYIGLLVLSLFGLWHIRPQGRSPVLWLVLFTSAALIGFWGHHRLTDLRKYLETKGMEWFYDIAMEIDPYRSITGLGYIGELKPSNRILFRARFPSAGVRTPLLLREATYNRYKSSKWFAIGAGFELMLKQNEIKWSASEAGDKIPGGQVVISTPLNKGIGLLKLPTGTHQITGLAKTEMEKNRFGAVKIRCESGILTYQAGFGSATPLDAPPGETDLSIPHEEKEAVEAIAHSLNLKSLPPARAIRKLNDYFEAGYTYSLTLNPRHSPTPLADFLKRTHTGHCEYFATATVLMLRAAGIPARYATGYSVHEWSPWEDAYVIRRRHAHAWAIAYVNNAWQNIDTTPSRWRTEEDSRIHFWERMPDAWSWLAHRFRKWRFQDKSRHLPVYLAACFTLLGLIIFRRLIKIRRKKTRKRPAAFRQISRPKPPGADSPFYAIEKVLAEKKMARRSGETLFQWLDRMEEGRAVSPACLADLRGLLKWHYRFRFDPEGLSSEETQAFEGRAARWQAECKSGINISKDDG